MEEIVTRNSYEGVGYELVTVVLGEKGGGERGGQKSKGARHTARTINKAKKEWNGAKTLTGRI